MKDEMLQNYKSDVSIIEKEVTFFNCLNPNDYIIEVKFNGLIEHIIQVNELDKGFYIFDSIRNSIRYEIAQYENKL